ncbi:acetoacetate--CoA ligase [Paraburkholderia sp. IMGN_8]|uniref:acetoacetate--CoA ligase n=1 Tax=Paraburkholderia sp. IMGN_8 TaxID=3136564 RepID=UPI0031014F94
MQNDTIPQTTQILWTPGTEQLQSSRLVQYQRWLSEEKGIVARDYAELWRWSVDDLEGFWQSIWDFFDIRADGVREPALGRRTMPGAEWFPNVRLNFAEHVFRNATPERPAVIARSEDVPLQHISWADLERSTSALAATLRNWGVQPGDRVASYMPNRPETLIAFLACASIGAIWSSCAPDMGAPVVLDRLRQIEAKVLFAIDSYSYNGKQHDRLKVVEELLAELPSVEHVVQVAGPLDCERLVGWRDRFRWDAVIANDAAPRYERLPFDHPLWILYSSGTTGLPKAMVHGHGGILLTHLKEMGLQNDLRPGDRLLFLGSTAWTVWNLLVGALVTGASIVLYDGHPSWPDGNALWRFMDEQEVAVFGTGAAVLIGNKKDGLRPRDYAPLKKLRTILSTGSPLPVDAFEWIYRDVKPDVWLASVSGGTDIASCFVACAPTLPVRAGEIQCPELGVAAYAFNEAGQAVVDEVGELVITQPMPSMPLYFWNDPDGRRYRDSYFEMYPGVWRQGDWIRFTSSGSSVIYGRSDSTINRSGIRIGTAEIYRVVEELNEVRDSLVIDLEYLGRPSFMPLFVVLQPGIELDEALSERIRQQIRTKASGRHVPDAVVQVREIPRTLSGKKMEVPVRKLLLGMEAAKVANPDTMQNPRSLDFFVEYAKTLDIHGLER